MITRSIWRGKSEKCFVASSACWEFSECAFMPSTHSWCHCYGLTVLHDLIVCDCLVHCLFCEGRDLNLTIRFLSSLAHQSASNFWRCSDTQVSRKTSDFHIYMELNWNSHTVGKRLMLLFVKSARVRLMLVSWYQNIKCKCTVTIQF